MRLDQVYIDGFKNLKDVTVNFDERQLTTVIIGQNGSGKSNLIEAITTVFRWIDLWEDEYKPKFRYTIEYRIDAYRICLSNRPDSKPFLVDGKEVSRAEFERRKVEWFPDLVFGYYSGSNRRLESLFDGHQRRYYDAIKLNNDEAKCKEAARQRRLFYCRPIHGVLALASFFAFPDKGVSKELKGRLGITGFHSLLGHFREPWFSRKENKGLAGASDFWGAAGPAGRTARGLRQVALYPMPLEGNGIDDYRDKVQKEAQYATFLPDFARLSQFADAFKDDREMFYALEAMDISDLVREVHLWVSRSNDDSGDVGFADLSDGERQLLMALGLIRVSRGKRALFLLDEPDTHLNPHWQHGYLKLIQDWTGIAADANNCHIILTSHNPLTISALTRDQVRVMGVEEDGRVTAMPPYTDPKGMGFTSTLTEIFGLPTSLDADTQSLVDDRNTLARIEQKTAEQEKQLIAINDKLARLGFLFEDREPLYQDFLRAWHDVKYANRPPLTPAQIEDRHKAMKELIQQLTSKGAVN